MDKYQHQTIEKKWQRYWEENKIFRTTEKPDKKKYYCLDMFPYPSGAGLHVGHPEGYTATDIVCRYRRMKYDENILHPMGFDSFGLPTENYAIKVGKNPKEITQQNIKRFTEQLKSFGFSYDWERQVITSDPAYYKWTQWMFRELYKKGLAYKKEAPVNWCESCKTVLAREQVIDGKCERCKNEVIQKNLSQWFFKITDYAEELLNDIEKLDWPEPIKALQRNWIGKSVGAEVKFKIKDSEEKLKVFTTRPDTLFGATFMVIAPEHPLIKKYKSQIINYKKVEEYIKQAQKKNELERTDLNKDKSGVELKGLKAINPVNNEEIPIFVADYVMMSYGTGAIMAVPAHDERDWEFAKKYGLKIVEVIKGGEVDKEAFTEIDSGKMVNSDFLNGLKPKEAIQKMIKWLEEKGLGKKAVQYKLRDWLVSRQRYWGAPIPIIYCEQCAKKVKENIISLNFYRQDTWNQLVSGKKTIETRALNPDEPERYFGKLKVNDYFKAVNKITNEEKYFKIKKVWRFKNIEDLFTQPKLLPLIRSGDKDINLENWKKGYAKNAPDYLDRIEKNGLIAFEVEMITPGEILDENFVELPDDVDFRPTGESPLVHSKSFHQVKCPVCGATEGVRREVDTMDTFVCSSWYFLRYCDPKNNKRPFDKEKVEEWMPVDLYVGGAEHAVLHLMYARFFTKALADMGYLNFREPFTKLRNQGMILAEDGRKMSKSLGNVINPDEVVAEYGADTFRMYEMFMGPLEDTKPWNTNSIAGVRRFLDRVWKLQEKINNQLTTNDKQELNRLLHQTIKKVTEDIEEMKFNTAISQMMILVNNLEKNKEISQAVFEKFLILLSPFAPHIAEEIWQRLGHKKSILFAKWPEYDKNLIRADEIELVVQVNGKVRDKIKVAADISEQAAKQKALESDKVQKWLAGKEPKKVIYVKGKLVSVVV